MATPPAEIFNKLIAQIAEEQNFDQYLTKIVPISGGGANYTTILYNITISDEKNVINLFAKIATTTGGGLRDQMPKLYETEIFAYTKLLKLYNKLQEEHKVPPEHRLSVPIFYGYHSKINEETVVLENLLLDGYMSYDRFKSIDWEYAKSALSQMAKMHALSFAYSEYYPEEFRKIIEDHTITYNENDQGIVLFKTMIDKVIGVTRGETKEKFGKYLENIDQDQLTEFFTYSKKKVLCHGDFKPSNFMHKIREDNTVDIKIVDFQTLQSSSLVSDLLYFIFMGSDEQFRAQYFDKALDHYYAELHAAMTRLHLNPEKVYSKEDFDEELKKKLPYGLFMSVLLLPIMTVAEENAPAFTEEMGLSALSIEETSDLYAERMNGVINDFIKWGIL